MSTYVWQGFLQEASANWPVEDFAAPADGLTQADIDPWTGLLAAPGGPSIKEWFIAGTEPKDRLSAGVCGDAVLTPGRLRGPLQQLAGGRPGLAAPGRDRARDAPAAPDRSRTSYFYNGRFQPYGASWGPLLGGEGCASPSPSPSCIPLPTPDASGVIPSIELPVPGGLGRVGLRGAGRAPLPDAVGGAVGLARGEPIRGTVAQPGGRRRRPRSRRRPEVDAEPRGQPIGPGRVAACPLTEPDGAIVDLHGVVVRRGGRTILGPLDWRIGSGERWVVIGANGSGKTTLLSVVGLTLWPTAGTVDVLGARYGRVDSREVRRRIGAAGSAVELGLRDDLTPIDLVMTARHAATEPWWHVFTDARSSPRPRAARPARAWGRSPIMRSGRCRRASGGARRSPAR